MFATFDHARPASFPRKDFFAQTKVSGRGFCGEPGNTAVSNRAKPRRAYLFPEVRGRGDQNSAALDLGPVVSHAKISAKLPKSFCSAHVRTGAVLKKRREIQGGGG